MAAVGAAREDEAESDGIEVEVEGGELEAPRTEAAEPEAGED